MEELVTIQLTDEEAILVANLLEHYLSKLSRQKPQAIAKMYRDKSDEEIIDCFEQEELALGLFNTIATALQIKYLQSS